MKRFAAFALALVLFTLPTVAMAVDHPKLTAIFDQYNKTILMGSVPTVATAAWSGPALTETFNQYEKTIVYGGD